jgi:hypothetical protein
MKTLGKVAALLTVLGFCLPSYGEILVYKYRATGTTIFQQDGEWHVKKQTVTGYFVVQVNYDDYTVSQAVQIDYRKDEMGKRFWQHPVNPELVRVEDGSHMRWVLLNEMDVVGEEATGAFLITMGGARSRNIGIAEKREVATAMSGSGLFNNPEGEDRAYIMANFSLTFYPSWTYWANGDEDDEGSQDFEATKQMIKDYLEAKGYTETEA